MILVRAQPLLRLTGSVIRDYLPRISKGNIHLSAQRRTLPYRTVAPLPENANEMKKYYEVYGALLWWWMAWRLISEFDSLRGHHIPKLSEWTDEELGIPPLEADDP